MLIVRVFSTLSVAIVLTACAAQMVSSPGASSTSAYAPVNEASRGGIVKYVNDGADFIKKKRREDAYMQMHQQRG